MTKQKKIDVDWLSGQLDRTHNFFPRIDSKVSALFAIVTAQVAIAGINLTVEGLRVWWVCAPFVVYCGFAIWVMANLYRCSYPNLEGGNSSLIYFQEIAKLREVEYLDKMDALDEGSLKQDLSAQIWRNSEILTEKFKALKLANIGAMLSLLPWGAFLLASSILSGKVPVVN